MSHTRRTLKLDRETWDLTREAAGGIALLNGGAATAQNVANEARLFTQDAYFIQNRGTPWKLVALGQRPVRSILRSYIRRAALRVPDVAEVEEINLERVNPETRLLSGEIQFKTREENDGQIRTNL